MKNQNVFTVFLVVFGLIISFFGGIFYQKSQKPAGFDRFNSQSNRTRFTQGTRPVAGTIIKKNEESITIKLRDGSTKIVFLTEKTKIFKSTPALKEELEENKDIFVIGQQNQDGSIFAENIQINR